MTLITAAILAVLLGTRSCVAFATPTTFISAVGINVCRDIDGGYGPGRVLYKTNMCECLDERRFRANCQRTQPNPNERYVRPYERVCDPNDANIVCLPTNDSGMLEEDCSCTPLQKKQGSKPPNDDNGIACSGGVSFRATKPADSVVVNSNLAVSTSNGLLGCYIQKGSIADRLFNHYPCKTPNDALDLTFQLGSTYQACIEANDVTPSRINFFWTITSPFLNRRKRDGLDLLDSIEFHHDPTKSNWTGSIIIKDVNGEEVKRFDGSAR